MLWAIIEGPEVNLDGRAAVRAYTSSIPLNEINMMLRVKFLKFLYGCNLHTLPTMCTHAAAVAGPKSTIKCLQTPYFDRALMEFIYKKSWWNADSNIFFYNLVVGILILLPRCDCYHLSVSRSWVRKLLIIIFRMDFSVRELAPWVATTADIRFCVIHNVKVVNKC